MIIGVSGKAGSGKDEMAKALIREYDFTRIAIADPMKRFVKALYREAFTDEDLWGPSEKRSKFFEPAGKTLRTMLQELGDKGRQIDEDIWIRPTMTDANKMILSGRKAIGLRYTPQQGVVFVGGGVRVRCEGVCIPDCRYPNELDLIRSEGGFTVRVKRKSAGLKGDEGLHPTETALDSMPDHAFDYVIDNNRSLSEFRAAIQLVAKDARQRFARGATVK